MLSATAEKIDDAPVDTQVDSPSDMDRARDARSAAVDRARKATDRRTRKPAVKHPERVQVFMQIRVGRENHRILLMDGRRDPSGKRRSRSSHLVLLDHPKEAREHEQTLSALGHPQCRCYQIRKAWDKYIKFNGTSLAPCHQMLTMELRRLREKLVREPLEKRLGVDQLAEPFPNRGLTSRLLIERLLRKLANKALAREIQITSSFPAKFLTERGRPRLTIENRGSSDGASFRRHEPLDKPGSIHLAFSFKKALRDSSGLVGQVIGGYLLVYSGAPTVFGDVEICRAAGVNVKFWMTSNYSQYSTTCYLVRHGKDDPWQPLSIAEE